MDMKELFENNCFPMSWSSESKEILQEKQTYVPQRKNLTTLLAELEDIKNNIEEIKAKQWYLAKLIKFHQEGFSTR